MRNITARVTKISSSGADLERQMLFYHQCVSALATVSIIMYENESPTTERV